MPVLVSGCLFLPVLVSGCLFMPVLASGCLFMPVHLSVGVCSCQCTCQWVSVPASTPVSGCLFLPVHLSVGVCSCQYTCQWVSVHASTLVSGCLFMPVHLSVGVCSSWVPTACTCRRPFSLRSGRSGSHARARCCWTPDSRRSCPGWLWVRTRRSPPSRRTPCWTLKRWGWLLLFAFYLDAIWTVTPKNLKQDWLLVF